MTERQTAPLDKDLVSIIVPVYNAERHLHETLESISAQSHTNLEAILVNDGSTDRSEAICREYCATDKRFKLINQENQGLSAARNTGTEEASGEWITYLDADDMLTKDALQTLLTLSKTTGLKLTIGRFSREMDFRSEHQPNAGFMILRSDEAITIGLYQKQLINHAWGALYHSSIFKGEDSLSFRKCYYEDLDFFYRAFERVGKVCITDRIVYLYRDNPMSFLNNWSSSRLDVLDVTDRIADHMKNRGKRLHDAALDRRFSAHFNILLIMMRLEIDLPQQKERCLRVIREQRSNELKDPNVRLKNKLGALASYMGMPMLRLMAKIM